jgi:hypothetical protein
MPQIATIETRLVAFAMLSAMQAEGVDWGEDDRASAREARAAAGKPDGRDHRSPS